MTNSFYCYQYLGFKLLYMCMWTKVVQGEFQTLQMATTFVSCMELFWYLTIIKKEKELKFLIIVPVLILWHQFFMGKLYQKLTKFVFRSPCSLQPYHSIYSIGRAHSIARQGVLDSSDANNYCLNLAISIILFQTTANQRELSNHNILHVSYFLFGTRYVTFVGKLLRIEGLLWIEWCHNSAGLLLPPLYWIVN